MSTVTVTQEKAKAPTMDAMRKRLLAAVCNYLTILRAEDFLAKDYQDRLIYARGVVCRAAKVQPNCFNKIGKTRLRSLTAMFNKMSRDMDGIVNESLNILTK